MVARAGALLLLEEEARERKEEVRESAVRGTAAKAAEDSVCTWPVPSRWRALESMLEQESGQKTNIERANRIEVTCPSSGRD